MKKTITAILALTLAASVNVTAFAANEAKGLKDKDAQSIDVKAKYVDSLTGDKVYSADIAWDSMEFTYTVSGSKSWNPQKHDYDINTTDEWSTDNNEITVTNHSNAPITASFAFSADAAYNLTGKFSTNSLSLPSAEGKALSDTVLVGKTAFTPEGVLSRNVADMTKVGTITVTVKGE